MTVPQSKFQTVLPVTDQSTPPNSLVAGQMTSLVFEVSVGGVKTVYSQAIDPATLPGATVISPFASLTPVFAPVAGKAYTADVYAVDAAGNGAASTAVAWTQLAAATPPVAPSSFGVV
jgi:hypothetical protein